MPFVAGDMDIGVADAAVQNLDLDIERVGFAALDGGRTERRSGVENGISFGFKHKCIFSTKRWEMQRGV